MVHSLLINAGDPPASDASLDCRRQASGSALLAGVMRERALMRYNAALRKATAMHSMSINAAYDIDVITGHFSRLVKGLFKYLRQGFMLYPLFFNVSNVSAVMMIQGLNSV